MTLAFCTTAMAIFLILQPSWTTPNSKYACGPWQWDQPRYVCIGTFISGVTPASLTDFLAAIGNVMFSYALVFIATTGWAFQYALFSSMQIQNAEGLWNTRKLARQLQETTRELKSQSD